MKNEMMDVLARAVQKAQNNPFFLANVLNEFQRQNNLNDASLAKLIGCKAQDLPRLALCRCPNTSQPTFASDVNHLAHRFGLHENDLANIIRQVGALHELRDQFMKTRNRQGMLLAARDREDDTITDQGEDK
jgi:hypothetical protein